MSWNRQKHSSLRLTPTRADHNLKQKPTQASPLFEKKPSPAEAFESHFSVVAYVFVTRFTSYEISFFCLQVINCELRSNNGLLKTFNILYTIVWLDQKSGATFCRQQVLPYKHLSHQNDSNFSQFFLPRSNMYIVWGVANSLIYMHCHLDCWSEHSPPRTAYLAPGIS